MSEIKHTPGEWRVVLPAKTGGHCKVTVARPTAGEGTRLYLLAVIENGAPGDTLKTEQANAALISAAPELLELAKKYEAWEAKVILCDRCWDKSPMQLTQELYDEMIELQTLRNAAVKKATGKA